MVHLSCRQQIGCQRSGIGIRVGIDRIALDFPCLVIERLNQVPVAQAATPARSGKPNLLKSIRVNILLGVLLAESNGVISAQRDDRREKNGGGKEASPQQSSHANEVHAAQQGEDRPQGSCCRAGIGISCLLVRPPLNCHESTPAHTSPGSCANTVDTTSYAVLCCAVLCCAVLCCAVLGWAALSCPVMSSAVSHVCSAAAATWVAHQYLGTANPGLP